jgi:hypothetical protein
MRHRAAFSDFSCWDLIATWNLEFGICGAGIGRLKRVLFAVFVAAGLINSTVARAATNVTDCTEDAFRSALALGGSVIFTNDCSITLSDTITITNNVVINGYGHTVTISGGDGVRIFTVQPGFTLVLANLILTGGYSSDGGALYVTAGGSAWITNCLFIGNTAAGSTGSDGAAGSTNNANAGKNGTDGTVGGLGRGGAIFNLGNLALLSSQIISNTASGGNGGSGGAGGGGLYSGGNGGNGGAGGAAGGGGLCNVSYATLQDCTFSANTATAGNGGSGGAAGSAPFAGISGNGAAGGGAYGAAVYSTYSLTAARCLFANNTCTAGNSAAGGTQSSGNGFNGAKGGDSLGGGICNTYVAWVTNSTFYNDSVIAGAGGDGGPGTYNGGNGGNGGDSAGGAIYTSANAIVVNCTLHNCSAYGGTNGFAGSGSYSGTDGSPGAGHGAGIDNAAGTTSLRGSILATNYPGWNISGYVTDAGYNLSTDGSLTSAGTSLIYSNPKLIALADNGGSTETIAISSTSPARDKIPSNYPATDQRGYPRPINYYADIGAYEYSAAGPPVITSQPADQTVAVGSNATFSVTAVGATPLSYRWLFFGTNAPWLTNATSSTLTINNVQTNQAGNYKVIVSNNYGSVTSRVAHLTVTSKPIITSQPQSVATTVGSNATFTVTATGRMPLTYQWRFNGVNIAAATNTAYTISNVQSNNQGNYRVVVKNSDGSVTSAVATLTVTLSPVITSQPTNQTVPQGSNATFTVTAVGAQPLSYQWFFNGTNILGATSNVLTLVSVQTNNSGFYNALVTNTSGSVTSAAALLTVSTAPTILTQPVAQVVVAGNTSIFSVTASGVPTPTFQWQFNGTNIASATSSSYTNNNTLPSNAGAYRAAITNAAGGLVSSNAMLIVQSPPSIVVAPSNQTVLVGTDAPFSVTAAGTAPLFYQWYFNGANIPGATSNVLALANAQPANAGGYTVAVTNSVGNITSPPATLTILTPASIIAPPTSRSVVSGSNATFTVSATGTAPLTYQWKFNGTNLNGKTTTSLTISHARPEDAGQYIVTVDNTYGSDHSDPAILTVLSSRPVISSSRVVSNHFRLTFQAESGVTYVVEYKTDLNGASWNTLTNLTPGPGSVTFEDPAPASPRRFYRLRVQ